MTDYMTMVMREAEQEAKEREIEARYVKRMHFNNLVRRAEFMGDVPARARFSKQIAEELIATHGAFAHLHALEKIEGYSSDELKGLWRDVLTWLDELGGDDEGGDKRRDFPEHRGEQTDSTDINR